MTSLEVFSELLKESDLINYCLEEQAEKSQMKTYLVFQKK